MLSGSFCKWPRGWTTETEGDGWLEERAYRKVPATAVATAAATDDDSQAAAAAEDVFLSKAILREGHFHISS
jgi:hypothetical protein